MNRASSRSKTVAFASAVLAALFLSQCVYLPIKRERRVRAVAVGMTLGEVEALLGPPRSGPRTQTLAEEHMDCPAGAEVETYQFRGYGHQLLNGRWEDNVGVSVIDGTVCSATRYGL